MRRLTTSPVLRARAQEGDNPEDDGDDGRPSPPKPRAKQIAGEQHSEEPRPKGKRVGHTDWSTAEETAFAAAPAA
jgi:hypothetical protein